MGESDRAELYPLRHQVELHVSSYSVVPLFRSGTRKVSDGGVILTERSGLWSRRADLMLAGDAAGEHRSGHKDSRSACLAELPSLRRRAASTSAQRAARARTAAHARIIDAAAEPALAQTIQTLMDHKYSWSDGLIVELAPAAGTGAV